MLVIDETDGHWFGNIADVVGHCVRGGPMEAFGEAVDGTI